MEPEIEHNFEVDSAYIDAVRIDRKQRGAFFTPDAIARYLGETLAEFDVDEADRQAPPT